MSKKKLTKTEKTVPIRTRLELSVLKKLDKLAKQSERSRSNYAGWVLKQHVEKEFNSSST